MTYEEELTKVIHLYKRKVEYIKLIKEESYRYSKSNIGKIESANLSFKDLIDRREEKIDRCKVIDEKLKTYKNIDAINETPEVKALKKEIAMYIKEIMDIQNDIKKKNGDIKKAVGSKMSGIKNSQKINNGYIRSSYMTEGLVFNRKK